MHPGVNFSHVDIDLAGMFGVMRFRQQVKESLRMSTKVSRLFKIIEHRCTCEEGKKWEDFDVGYCASLESAFKWLEKNNYTKWDTWGFSHTDVIDSRRSHYRIEEYDPPEMEFLDSSYQLRD